MNSPASRPADAVRATAYLICGAWLILIQRVNRRFERALVRLSALSVQAHYALAKFRRASPKAIRIALNRQAFSVGMLSCLNLLLCRATCEQQDDEITHFVAPFVDDKGSIYFLPRNGLTNAYERFAGVRK